MIAFLLLVASLAPAAAPDPDRDFSGRWLLDAASSDADRLPGEPDSLLLVTHSGSNMHCSAERPGNSPMLWVYPLGGGETRYRNGGREMSSAAKWEGAALLTNTLVGQNHAVMDRWKLSRDRNVMTIRRQVVRGTAETEGTLVYRREGAAPALPEPGPPLITRRTDAPTAGEITVRAGTRIPLALINSISTRHARENDRVYLETVFPIVLDGRIAIPRGSYVAGTVIGTKRAGRATGRSELLIRFDTLTLPNGVTREFRSRLGAADGAASQEIARNEGKVTGEGGKAGDARTVGEAAGAGSSVGAIAGSTAGRIGMGAGIGAAAGAAAGLASVLFSRGPDATLPKGATAEMVLDRDLRFTRAELTF